MLLAYTDESYSDAHYYQIAFILRSEDCILLDAILEEAMAYSSYFGIDQDVEFHGNKIMSARKGWEPLGNNFRAKLSIFRFIFTRLATIDASILIQGVDVKRLKNRYKYPDPPHEITQKHLLEAIDRFAEREGMTVRLISDHINTQYKLEELFSKYRMHSTGGESPRYLNNIVGIEHVDSRFHSGIQIADLCAFIFRRFDEHNEKNENTRRRVVELWEILDPLLNDDFPPRVWRP